MKIIFIAFMALIAVKLVISLYVDDRFKFYPLSIVYGAVTVWCTAGHKTSFVFWLAAFLVFAALCKVHEDVMQSQKREQRPLRVLFGASAWLVFGVIVAELLYGSFRLFHYHMESIKGGLVAAAVYVIFIQNRFVKIDRIQEENARRAEELRVHMEHEREAAEAKKRIDEALRQARRDAEEYMRREAEEQRRKEQEARERERAQEEQRRKRAQEEQKKKHEKQQKAAEKPPYFDGCHDKKTLEKRFKTHCKTLHPDVPGGDEEEFKKMHAEYERVKKRIA